MKTSLVVRTCLLSVLTVLALDARAAEPRPAIDPISPELNPVATMEEGGGMPVPGGVSHRSISIMRTGRVVVNEVIFTHGSADALGKPEDHDYELTPLQPMDMLNLGEAIGALHGGAIMKSTGPGCEDAPSAVYRVHKSAEKIFTILRTVNCQTLELKDPSQREAAQVIKAEFDRLRKELH